MIIAVMGKNIKNSEGKHGFAFPLVTGDIARQHDEVSIIQSWNTKVCI